MNANAFEFNTPMEAKGSNSAHDNFVSDFMEGHENKYKEDGSKSASDSIVKSDDARGNEPALSDEQVNESGMKPETRMDGNKLYGEKGDGEPKKLTDHIKGVISELENITKAEELPRQTDSLKDYLPEKKKAPVTDKDREIAKNELEGEIPEIVDEATRKRLVAIQDAIIDGDMEGLSNAFKSLGKDAKDLPKYLKEINRQLKELGSDTELIGTKDGRVFVHDGSGDLAVQINPDGTNEVRAIDRTKSGAIVVNPGEVLNRSVEDVGKNIGDSTTREIQKSGRIYIDKLPNKFPDKGGYKGKPLPDGHDPGTDFEPGDCFPGKIKPVPMPEYEVPEGGMKPVPMPEYEVPEGGIKPVPMPEYEVPDDCDFAPKQESGQNKNEKGGMQIPKDSEDDKSPQSPSEGRKVNKMF